ncbi:hypothetical protein CY34DRAFT_749595 [Suillus luteus UH-Slu-Lm8-n1]|uniref:Uncharacterized protein n=1 Tax=Suillus luteus UH-Slu-Lm8-n1 TaxID=930992 RepID=A0A0D0BI95_9AGAM|nr:hypothetical protein CY34DRAFT_749595 [Suillus luteus UH-Slu-Lm8-n1]
MLRSLGLFKMLRIIYQIGLDVVPCWLLFTRKNTKVDGILFYMMSKSLSVLPSNLPDSWASPGSCFIQLTCEQWRNWNVYVCN